MDTSTPLTFVDPELLLLLPLTMTPALQEYEPAHKTLIDPPYALAPFKAPPTPLDIVTALQFEEEALVTAILTAPTLDPPEVLLLLPALLLLQEYEPAHKTLIDPPYALAPFKPPPTPLDVVKALQFEERELLINTVTSLAPVTPEVLLLLPPPALLLLQEYEPM